MIWPLAASRSKRYAASGREENRMTNPLDVHEFQARLQRLDSLLQEVDRFADLAARTRTQEIVQALLNLHGLGLERIRSHLESAGAAGQAVLDACVRDDVVGGLLLLHGVHPLDLEARVQQALEQVRPYLRSHGGNVEVLGVENGVVRLRLQGSCHSCPSSAVTMKQTIEEAILARAPDAAALELEGELDSPAATTDGRVRVALPIL
jgi:Fe-S cluster biogenesis protein NfuA